MVDVVRDMHTASGLLDELAAGITLERGRGAGARVRPRARARAAARRRWPATRSTPTAASSPATCPRSTSTCTTGWSTSPRSRSWPGAGTRGSTSPPPPSTAATARWPTSGRASRSCGTTGQAVFVPQPGPDTDAARGARRRSSSPAAGGLTAGRADGDRGPCMIHCAAAAAVRMVGVAQLVEHLVVVQGVAGSSPVTHPTKCWSSAPVVLGRQRPLP